MRLNGRKPTQVNSIYPSLYDRQHSRGCMDLRIAGANSNVTVMDKTGKVIKILSPEGEVLKYA